MAPSFESQMPTGKSGSVRSPAPLHERFPISLDNASTPEYSQAYRLLQDALPMRLYPPKLAVNWHAPSALHEPLPIALTLPLNSGSSNGSSWPTSKQAPRPLQELLPIVLLPPNSPANVQALLPLHESLPTTLWPPSPAPLKRHVFQLLPMPVLLHARLPMRSSRLQGQRPGTRCRPRCKSRCR